MPSSDHTLLKPLTHEEQLAQQNKQVAFLQAIHAFVGDRDIQGLFEERREQGVAALMRALSTLEPYVYMGVTSYILGTADKMALRQYLRPDRQIDDFFQKIGNENHHKPVLDWDRLGVEVTAGERMGHRNLFHIHDLFEKMANKAGIPLQLKQHIANTLLDIAWRDPREVPVTIENIAKMLRDADIPKHFLQDRYWVDLKQELQDIHTHDPELKSLVDIITRAATQCGLFTAIHNLLGDPERDGLQKATN